MSCNKKHIPEPGRGFILCDCGEEMQVKPVEGCYKLHETPWLDEYPDNIPTDIFEVRFKNTRRSYYKNVNNLDLKRGDIVAVEASPGHDIGIISLTGDMVAKQIRRTGFTPFNGEYKKIYRKAKPYDIERWQEAIALEHDTMIQSRQIAAEMGLDMKIGDVEYQGDKIKAIFYYIAEGRVDFRELIKVFAERFHIRIEMKQIGARQEAGRIGGIGACGRELCCASWVSSFSSVTTNAARVQDISLNPQKLAGQCSKLKCCLMYEYDVYADARQTMPRVREPLQAMDGEYYLVKTDILARTMSFSSSKETMSNVVTIPTSRVREIIAANRAGRKVESIALQGNEDVIEEPTFRTEEDSITRFDNQNRRRRNRNRRDKDSRHKDRDRQPKAVAEGEQAHEEGREEGRQRQERRRDRQRNNRQDAGSENRTQQQGDTPQNDTPKGEGQRRDRRRNNRSRNRGENQQEGRQEGKQDSRQDNREGGRNERRQEEHRTRQESRSEHKEPKQE
jgi:cell fate regulator YaaT (PSP1 superfamily)